jgi:hypothetical protein
VSTKQPFEIDLAIQQFSKQSIDVTLRVLGLIPLSELIKLFDKLDLLANPRDAKKSTITKEIQNTLIDDPEIFPLKSKGILISGSSYREGKDGHFSITFDDLSKEG